MTMESEWYEVYDMIDVTTGSDAEARYIPGVRRLMKGPPVEGTAVPFYGPAQMAHCEYCGCKINRTDAKCKYCGAPNKDA